MATKFNATAPAELSRSDETMKLLERVKQLLDEGKPREAIKALSGEDSEWARNARAVCYLRLGDPNAAVDILRGLTVAGHLTLKPEAPLVFKTNFATALLLAGNLGGGLSTLDDIRNEKDPRVEKLRAAFKSWKASLGLWQRLSLSLGGEPARPFTLDFPPGEL